MRQLYFHCASRGETQVVDRAGTSVNDLIEARDYAVQIMQSLIGSPNLEDWRDWILFVSDTQGCEIFAIPFSSMLGKPH